MKKVNVAYITEIKNEKPETYLEVEINGSATFYRTPEEGEVALNFIRLFRMLLNPKISRHRMNKLKGE